MVLVGAKAAGAQHGNGTARDKSPPSIHEMSKLDQEKFQLHMRLQASPPSTASHPIRIAQYPDATSFVSLALCQPDLHLFCMRSAG